MHNNQIFDAIIQVNPIFTESIDASILEYSGQTLPYIWGGDQVRNAANSFSTESTQSIDSLIELIETLLHSPSQKVREFASIGLIEYMQNDSIVPIHVQKYILGKMSASSRCAWDDVTKFWNKEIPFIPDRG
jgi:hypothetical protein